MNCRTDGAGWMFELKDGGWRMTSVEAVVHLPDCSLLCCLGHRRVAGETTDGPDLGCCRRQWISSRAVRLRVKNGRLEDGRATAAASSVAFPLTSRTVFVSNRANNRDS